MEFEFAEISAWAGDRSEHPNPRPYAQANVSPQQAAAICLILWPNFIEHRGSVFLGYAFDASSIDTWFVHLDGDGPAVESVVNHVHLWDLFLPNTDEDYKLMHYLAGRVAAAWEGALRDRFPDRSFVVIMDDGDAENYGPTVTFRSLGPVRR